MGGGGAMFAAQVQEKEGDRRRGERRGRGEFPPPPPPPDALACTCQCVRICRRTLPPPLIYYVQKYAHAHAEFI